MGAVYHVAVAGPVAPDLARELRDALNRVLEFQGPRHVQLDSVAAAQRALDLLQYYHVIGHLLPTDRAQASPSTKALHPCALPYFASTASNVADVTLGLRRQEEYGEWEQDAPGSRAEAAQLKNRRLTTQAPPTQALDPSQSS